MRADGDIAIGPYYTPVEESEENLELMRLLDEQYTRAPLYGVRRMTYWLWKQGHGVNVKRVRRLMRWMGLEDLSEAAAVPAGARTPDLPLPTARVEDRSAQPGVGQ